MGDTAAPPPPPPMPKDWIGLYKVHYNYVTIMTSNTKFNLTGVIRNQKLKLNLLIKVPPQLLCVYNKVSMV